MNPQQNQLALLTVFGSPAVVDYLKNLLQKQENISHTNAELHYAAFNSLTASQNMNSQIQALKTQIEAELKQQNQVPPMPPPIVN